MESPSYTLPGTDTTIRAGDCVFVRSMEPSEDPWVAKVDSFVQDHRGGTVLFYLSYFYRRENINPEERRDWHGEKELFLSTAASRLLGVGFILGKCEVYSFEEYESLKETGDDEFFTRLEYDPIKGKMLHKSLQLYCTCKKPANPDLKMVMCEKCKDWFHPSCVYMTEEEVDGLDDFLCEACYLKL